MHATEASISKMNDPKMEIQINTLGIRKKGQFKNVCQQKQEPSDLYKPGSCVYICFSSTEKTNN